MRTRTTALMMLALLSLGTGCPAPGTGGGDGPAAADLATPPAGADLAAEADLTAAASCGGAMCGGGEVCQGAPGCVATWACGAAACTRDLVSYCGCDGVTFRSSGSCPGRPYLHRGACGGACEAQEAAGVGACDALIGVFFDGVACRYLSGCRCEGRDCKSAYATLELCQMAHKGCKAGPRADGAPCSRGADCDSGVCEGEGCGVDEARCVPKVRACTRDLVQYCGCDGVTFQSSSTCPGRPYRKRGPC